MDAFDIQRHFRGLRVDSARRRGRQRDPFATGFEDDSDDNTRKTARSRTKKQASPPVEKAASPPVPSKDSISSPFAAIDALRDSDDDFLDVSPKRTDRRPSPAPSDWQSRSGPTAVGRRGSVDKTSRPQRSAKAQAAGNLAFLDDSSDDDQLSARPSRSDRRPSPSPRNQSYTNDQSDARSTTPGDRAGAKEQSQTRRQLSRHTVASPFAGTKYLEDSSSDEEAVTSRTNSTDATATTTDAGVDLTKLTHEIQRIDKPKQNGSGVSWRAFSAGRNEQRYADFEALQANLQRRGRAISFCPHATTDDGQRVPLSATSERPAGPSTKGVRPPNRRKSPPRRADDTTPADDELDEGGVYDPIEYKTNPFTGEYSKTVNALGLSQR